LEHEFGNGLPAPLTEEAQKERERFLNEVRKQVERARQVSLTVLVWGQSEHANTPVSQKRISIRDHLCNIGHNALFSESISTEECFKDLSEKSKEFSQALSAHLIIILLEGAYSGVNRPAFRGKPATLPDETGHPSGANRPPLG